MRRLALIIILASLPTFASPISQVKLDKLAVYWSHVLRLDDWTVYVDQVSLDQLPEGTSGASHPVPELKIFQILVLRPEDYGKLAKADGTLPLSPKAINRDIEDTVVHELIHLRLRDLMVADDAHLKSTEELTVVRLTGALMKLKKGK